MPVLLKTFLTNFALRFVQDKMTSAVGAAVVAGAVGLPEINQGAAQFVAPNSTEEALLQIVMGLVGLFLMWYRRESKRG